MADLVGEMGVYDLYDWYGLYVWDRAVCCRLMVDTGINALGWLIEKAHAFMKENTFLTDSEIFMETLRYAVDMLAQALAYIHLVVLQCMSCAIEPSRKWANALTIENTMRRYCVWPRR